MIVLKRWFYDGIESMDWYFIEGSGKEMRGTLILSNRDNNWGGRFYMVKDDYIYYPFKMVKGMVYIDEGYGWEKCSEPLLGEDYEEIHSLAISIRLEIAGS